LFPANQLIGFGAVRRAKLVVILKPDPMGKLPIQTVNADSHIKESRKIQLVGMSRTFRKCRNVRRDSGMRAKADSRRQF
jgi:hypothetical protein